VLAVNCIRFFN